MGGIIMYLSILNVIKMSIDLLSVSIIIIGVVKSTISIGSCEFSKLSATEKLFRRQAIRAQLGSYILLSLELLIASDIIETIAHPSVDEMLILTATVLIRTFIAFFLNKEIEAVAKSVA